MRNPPRFLACALLTAGLVLAQSRFSERLTADEFVAAGLDHLSPAQLAELNALVQKDRERSGPSDAAPPSAPQHAPEPTRALASEGPAAPTVASAGAEHTSPRRTFGLPVHEDARAITGVLDGDYRGWTGTTLFRLQDGQIWAQEDRRDQHDAAPQHNPRVTISKSMFGGYKLKVDGDPEWVRVRRMQ